jgi:hypothetical protein
MLLYFLSENNISDLYFFLSFGNVAVHYTRTLLSRVACVSYSRVLDWMIVLIAPYTFTTQDYRQLQRYR